MTQIKMTITVPQDIHRMIKINSAKTGTTMKEFIVEAVLFRMEAMLARQERKKKERLEKEKFASNKVTHPMPE